MEALLNLQIKESWAEPLFEVTHPALLPIGERSLLLYNCDILANLGVNKITIMVSERAELIEKAIEKEMESFNSSGVDIEFAISDTTLPYSFSESFISEESNEPLIYVPALTLLTKNGIKKMVNDYYTTDFTPQFSEDSEKTGVAVFHNRDIFRFHIWQKGKSRNCSKVKFEQLDKLFSIITLNKKLALFEATGSFYSLGKNVVRHGLSLIGDSVSIGDGVTLKNSIVLSNTTIKSQNSFENSLISGSFVVDLESGEVSEQKEISIPKTVTPVLVATRLIDITLSAVALLLLSPLFFVVAVLIKLDSRGPIFYQSLRQTAPERKSRLLSRKSKNVPFTVFRTMFTGADAKVESSTLSNCYENGPYKKFINDIRITKIGSFLRKTSIDELPLLWHVFTGDLSLVGTWALPKYEAEAIETSSLTAESLDLSPVAKVRFESRPGVAGLWQCGGRSTLTADERAVLDAVQTAMERPEYRSAEMPNLRYSLRGYLGVICTTVKSVIACKGAQ